MSDLENVINEEQAHQNPLLAMTAEKGESELKDYLVNYVGTKLDENENRSSEE